MEIQAKTTREFIDKNHIQGYAPSSINIALYYKEEPVCIMTFGKSRYNKMFEYEVVRFCNKLNTQVLGGAGKCWSYFLKKYNPTSVISFADRRYSNGNLYKKLGFKLDHISKQNYFYYIDESILLSRVKCQKHKLKSLLKNFDINKTEVENMFNNGYRRIWDAGNYVFVWKKS